MQSWQRFMAMLCVLCELCGDATQSLSPSVVTENIASPSGRFGESTSLAILFSPLDLRRYSLNVAVCPTICPPMGFVGSPKNASGFDITWLVTIMAAL